MRTPARLLLVVSLIPATIAAVPAQAQPIIIDVHGALVAVPAGLARNGAPTGYLNINNSVVLVYFHRLKLSSTQMDWWFSEESNLFFRSGDCSGPALLSGANAFGTVPAILVPEKNHTWLHMADSTEGLGRVEINSYMTRHKRCVTSTYTIAAWKAMPAIDLNTQFTPPFSIR